MRQGWQVSADEGGFVVSGEGPQRPEPLGRAQPMRRFERVGDHGLGTPRDELVQDVAVAFDGSNGRPGEVRTCDALEVPALILPSIQVNVRAGELPAPEDDGVSYLRLPVNVLGWAAS